MVAFWGVESVVAFWGQRVWLSSGVDSMGGSGVESVVAF